MIKKISLANFRNFRKKEISFSLKTTVIFGENASGKTNLLEAIYLISTGKSFKAQIEEEMINYDSEIARVKGDISKDTLEVVLTRGKIETGESVFERVPRKRLLVNGTGKRLIDFSENLKTTLFSPKDLDLITESPSLRRKFLDNVISQSNREYKRAVLSYEKGLRRRNKILLRIREEGIGRSHLLFWDRLLIKNGDYISQKREEFIGFIDQSEGLDNQEFEVFYDKSAISEGRLKQYEREEVAAATTLVGPHRDDFTVKIKNHERARDLSRYGSRGEQRMGVLWLKLAELGFLKENTNENPTLLLDDIFSELDKKHKEVVIDVVGNQQTIITTADENFKIGESVKTLKL